MTEQTPHFYADIKDKNVATLILNYLKLEGVTHLFGIPGGGLKQLLEELRLRNKEFSYIICRQESGAAFMADGYHRVSGKLGVVMVTSGPGATNALTGSMNAQADHSAVLIITGEVPEEYIGMGYLQEGVAGGLKMDTLYRNAVYYSQLISSPNNLHTLITQALRDSFDLPRHATHLSLPNNVSEAIPDAPIPFPTAVSNYRAKSIPSNPEQTKEAFELLMKAKRPLIFLGNGNRFTLRNTDPISGEQTGRRDRFQAFVNRFAIPVMTTPDGKALYPESDEMSLRAFGLASCQWPPMYLTGKSSPEDTSGQPYDALLVIGSTLGELATNKWASMLTPQGPFIQIDADHAVIGRSFPMHLGIVSDAGKAMDTLCQLGADTEPDDTVEERRSFIQAIKRNSPYRSPDKRNSDAVPIMPQAMSKIINEELPTDGCHIFIDGGNCIGWALHYMKLDPPTQIHNSLDMGPMGFGTCSVVGGKFAAPDMPCICLTGDGGFMMQGSEISTAAQYNQGVIWIVEFNNDLGMVSQGNAHFFPTPVDPSWIDYYKLGNPDLCKYAEGLGADVYEVNTPAEMREHFRTALHRADEHNKPQVIVVNIDTKEIPPYYPVKKPG